MKKALIIEDNEDNMRLITVILRKNGYITMGAENGRKGIDMAVREKPDFIILDIQLPDMNGTDVLKEIRTSEMLREMPVIAMTSHAMSGDRERLLSAGCSGYIEKPIDPYSVIDQIKSITGEKG